MSTSIKPEFYLSWLPNGNINLSPQIFISYIPNGEIKFIPKIYASVVQIPHIEKATADTSRNISANENISADTFRKVEVIESTRADFKRHVKNIEKAVADTSRKMGVEITNLNTCRALKNLNSTTADTLCKVGITENVSVDSFRKIARREKISADSFLQIKKTEKATADTSRRLLERASADISRKVVRNEKAVADSVIRIPHVLNYIPQNSIVNSFKNYDVTAFNVTLGERTLSDSFNLETAKKIDINDAVKGTFLDYPYSFLVEETTEQDLFFSIKGMYDIDKLLYSFVRYENVVVPATTIVIGSNSYGESSSTDSSSYSITGRRLISMADEDYNNYTKADYYAKKCAEFFGFTPNIKFENFSPSNLDDDSDITYSDLISSLFSWTAKVPQRQINVFIRGEILHFIQRGLEDSVFDISNIPHSRPVVNKKLIRTLFNTPFDNDTLPLEKISNADTTDTPDTPSNPVTPVTPEDKTPINPEYFEYEISTPFTGTLSYKDDDESVYITYHGGLIAEEGTSIKQEKQESTQTTTYGYTIYENEYYLKSKTVINTAIRKKNNISSEMVVTKTVTTYKYLFTYDDIYLAKEREIQTKKNYRLRNDTWNLTNEEETTRATYHNPVGNGFYSTSVYVDGEIQGSSISQGKPGNKVSPYTVTSVQRSLNNQSPYNDDNNGGESPSENSGGGNSGGGNSGGRYDSSRFKEFPDRTRTIDNDISFPVREFELLSELIEAYKWLNRKIQVTVNVDLISRVENGVPDLKHIVDFTERVKLDGVEYFLVSNNISFTPRSLIQKLQLVRWTV